MRNGVVGMRRAALAIAVLTTVILAGLYGWGRDRAPFEILEGQTLDWRFLLRGPIAPGGEVTILAVDDTSIEALGGWPLPRQSLADVVDRLNQAGARTIAFDLLLLELEQPTIGDAPGFGDQRLIAAIRRSQTTILPFVLSFEETSSGAPVPSNAVRSSLRVQRWRGEGSAGLPHPAAIAVPPAPLLEAAYAAFATVIVEADGALRAINLVLPFAGELYPALPLEAVRLQRRLPPDNVVVEFDRALRLGGVQIETAPHLRLPINYYGPPGTFDVIPIHELIAGTVDSRHIHGKLVWIGATALGLGDRFATPFSGVFPGVEFFATAADNLLTGRWLKRGDVVAIIDIVAIAAAAGLGAAIGTAVSAGLAASALLALATVWFVICAAAFNLSALWLSVIFPVVSTMFAGGAAVLLRAIVEGRARRRAESERRRLARYVPAAIADDLARDDRPRFDERTQPASILFVDMAGFTRTTETMQSETVLRLVRRLHGLIESTVRQHGGIVDKYIGDGAMILFGLPEPQVDDPARALACARALAVAIDRWNEERERDGEPALALGAGLHHGPVIVARIGDRHSQITAMGDSVNVASRLERVTREISARIVVSHALATAVGALGRKDLLEGFSYEGERKLKGRDHPIGLWRWPSADEVSPPTSGQA